jgi:hypothetical protein
MMLTAPSPCPTFCIMSAAAIPEYAAQIAAAAVASISFVETAIVFLPAWLDLLRSESGLCETVARPPGF